MITFSATPKFPSSDCSCDVQIWPLSFAPCLTHLFVPPCTDPSTRPHIQESDVQVTCWLKVWYYYYKRLFPYIRLLPPTPNFPFMIYPALSRSTLSVTSTWNALRVLYVQHSERNMLCISFHCTVDGGPYYS